MKEEDIPSRVLLNLASQVTPSHRGGDDMAGSTKEAAVVVELCTSAYLYLCHVYRIIPNVTTTSTFFAY